MPAWLGQGTDASASHMRNLLPQIALCALAVLCAPVARAQAGNPVSIESSPQMFATLAALYAAGYDSETGATQIHPVRARLRSEMYALQGPAVEELRKFYREHRLADSAATLSRYVSFALTVGPPPKFQFETRREQLPPDVLLLEGFNEVLAKFYQEAEIAKRWQQLRPQYEREIQRLRQPLGEIVLSSSGYLRELMSVSLARRFVIYVEPAVGGRTNLRNYGDLYAIVLNPGSDLPLDEIRHAYLHFLVEPLASRYQSNITAKQTILSEAGRAPRLAREFKDDFSALMIECLVRAVELRLKNPAAAQLAAALDEADADGFVLVRPLHRELQKFEKAEPAMTYYFPDLLAGISVGQEIARLKQVKFAEARADVPAATEGASGASQMSELEQMLVEGERLIAQPDAPAAAATFAKILERDPENPRALYGAAVAAILQGQAEPAKEGFRKLVSSGTGAAARNADPRISAWSHVYLGRIHDVEGNRDLAVSEYRAALSVSGAPEAALAAARRGLERGYQPRTPGN